MRFLLACFSLFCTGFVLAGEAPIKECKEAKAQGACSDMVETAVNVCEDKQKGRDITAKRLKDAKDSKMGTGSNFKELEMKYKNLESSARSDSQNQKACVEAATALKKDCKDYCSDNDSNGESCNKSLYSLDQIRNFCKQNEEAAEEIAAMAEKDASMIGQVKLDTGPGSVPNSGTTTGGTTPPNPPSAEYLGYTGQRPGGDNSSDSDMADALAKGLLGSGSGSGASGGDAKSGAGIDSSGDSGLGKGGAAKSASGTANGNLNGGDSGGSTSGDSGANAQAKGKAEAAPGYMFWGVPPRKKKPPLTLLTKPSIQNPNVAAQKKDVNKKPASTQTRQTQTPAPKQ